MCFCAGASFGAGFILSVAGAVTLTVAKTPSQRIFASIPFIFSVQQFAEGILWIAFSRESSSGWQSPATHLFLFFAYVVWPVWIPLSMFLLEKNKVRKKILAILLITGWLLSSYLFYSLLAYPVTAAISDRHIQYAVSYPPGIVLISNILYFIVTVFSPFVSGVKKMNILGFALLATFVVSKIFFNDYIVSVWCYFAAFISLLNIYILYSLQKNDNQTNSLERVGAG